jgi:hypothetical protein
MGGGTAFGLATAYGRCQMRILTLAKEADNSSRVIVGGRDECLSAESERSDIALVPVKNDE